MVNQMMAHLFHPPSTGFLSLAAAAADFAAAAVEAIVVAAAAEAHVPAEAARCFAPEVGVPFRSSNDCLESRPSLVKLGFDVVSFDSPNGQFRPWKLPKHFLLRDFRECDNS